METERQALAASFLSALRPRGAQASPKADREAARRLGRRAATLLMTAEELAKLQLIATQELLAASTAPSSRAALRRRSAFYFKEASSALLEAGKSGVRSAAARLESIVKMLTRRTRQLAAANEKLRREIAHRKAVEQSLRAGERQKSSLLAQSQRMQLELRQLSRRLLSAQEEERKRISRELHDVVAQTLSGINLRLTLLQKRSTANTKDLHLTLATTQAQVLEAVEIVHRFARDLRPALLDDLGLLPAVRSHLKLVAAETGLQTDFSASPSVEHLGLAQKTALFRIFQQAVSNIVEHASANRVTVRITRRSGAVRMVVRDNGRGFKTRDVFNSQNVTHLGLLGMRERAEMIGGMFSVASTPGKSTRIEVVLPPAKPQPKKGASPAGKRNKGKP